MKTQLATIVLVICLCFVSIVQAQPQLNTLQLDILNGTYDSGTQTIIAPDAKFDLYALLSPDKDTFVTDTFYLSMAVTPKIAGEGANLGSFIFNGTNVNVTSDMVYGAPPIETNLARQNGDLQKHSIFETYFKEISFNFDSTKQLSPYNSQDRAMNGGAIPAGTGMYYQVFEIDTTNLLAGYYIHFDLYATSGTLANRTITEFAPFSHDAQSNGHKVPEPGTLALLGMGLVGIGFFRRRK